MKVSIENVVFSCPGVYLNLSINFVIKIVEIMHCSKVYSTSEFFQNCFASIKCWRIGKIELSRGRINYFF